jgi:type II secretory pathway pseudopilin PulG
MTVNSSRRSRQGFTFLEVLVFTAIISFLFIGLTSTVISSLRRMQTTEHRLYATRYAEELLEWVRAQKETGWESFVADYTSETGTLYCFNGDIDFYNPVWPPAGLGTCDYDGIGSKDPRIFKRYLILTAPTEDLRQVNVQIVVEWRDGNQFYSVPLNTIFTDADEN